MAERCDRVGEYTEENLIALLKALREREKFERVFEKTDEELVFLKRCLGYLDEKERDILLKTYSDGVSMRNYSRYSGFSRAFIAKHRADSVALLTKFFNVKFQ